MAGGHWVGVTGRFTYCGFVYGGATEYSSFSSQFVPYWVHCQRLKGTELSVNVVETRIKSPVVLSLKIIEASQISVGHTTVVGRFSSDTSCRDAICGAWVSVTLLTQHKSYSPRALMGAKIIPH